ncbi:hypothetical protein D043_0353A, partial [Vibrio parahaemolyticus EKP-021]
MPRITRNRV